MGLVYTLFLLFQVDIKQFLFTGPIISCGIKKRIRTAYQNGYYKKATQGVQLNGHLQHQDGVEIKFMDGSVDGHVDSNVRLTEGFSGDNEHNLEREKEMWGEDRGRPPGESAEKPWPHGGTTSMDEPEPEPRGAPPGGQESNNDKSSGSRVATGSGILIIMFYYFQVII